MSASFAGSRYVRVVASALGAAILYGSWAYYANRAFGPGIALRAALVQALWSMTITTLMSLMLEYVALRLLRSGRSVLWVCAPGLLSVYCAPLPHLLNGTPEVLRTVAPSLIIGSLFVIGYTLRLRKLARGQTTAPSE